MESSSSLVALSSTRKKRSKATGPGSGNIQDTREGEVERRGLLHFGPRVSCKLPTPLQIYYSHPIERLLKDPLPPSLPLPHPSPFASRLCESLPLLLSPQNVPTMTAEHAIPSCELCGGRATLYCPSDSAFLCPSCDSRVHLANFLVSRHLRQPLCPSCHSVPPCATCPSLPFAEESPRASSSSSACISTTQSSASVVPCGKAISLGADEITSGRRSRGRATRQDALFVMWCERMGLEKHAGRIVPGASSVLEVCRGRLKALPLRVAAAASFWWAVRRWSCGEGEGGRRWQGGKRLEEVTGVPWRLILAAEAKLRMAQRRRSVGGMDAREGWAECG